MPSKERGSSKWRAQVRKNGKVLYLGAYTTYEIARQVEIEFRERHKIDNSPSARGKRSWETREMVGL